MSDRERDSCTVFKPSEFHVKVGAEIGDHSVPGEEHDTRGPGDAGQIPLGTDEGGKAEDSLGSEAGEFALRTEDVLRRFTESSRARLRPETIVRYCWIFRRLAKTVRLELLTRRQLAGPRGRRILLEHLERIPRPSWRPILAALKAVWTIGLDLPWPLDSKRDLGRLPPIRRRESPPDERVKAWADALVHESDPYGRLLWLLVAQHGWRPSHVCRLKWHHVRLNSAGRPVAIVADGTEAGFKTSASVAARLAPDVVEALEAWRRVAPKVLPELPILPWRSYAGRIEPPKEHDSQSLWVAWRRLRKKWDLPALRPVDLRHWCATACRRAGLSKQASACLMGHDPAAGGAMRDWYDRPHIEDMLAEQAERLPRGPLGLLEPAAVMLADGVPKEAAEVLRAYLAEEIGTFELATSLERIRLKMGREGAPRFEP